MKKRPSGEVPVPARSAEAPASGPADACRVADEAPSLVGANATSTVQLPPGASDEPAQPLPLRVNCEAPPPPGETATALLAAVPPFVRVKRWVALVCPRTTIPKSWSAGEKERLTPPGASGVGAAPSSVVPPSVSPATPPHAHTKARHARNDPPLCIAPL